MAWSSPRTWIAGEIVTAAILNTDHRDNLLILKTSIDDNGNIKHGTKSVTSTYAVLATDHTLRFSGTFTATLLTAVGRAGKHFNLTNVGTGVITIATTSSQTISGFSSYLLDVQWRSITVESDDANWIIT